MRQCFLTVGPWRRNAGLIRFRELGPAMLDRGEDVVYLVDDMPDNHVYPELDPRARVVWVRHPNGVRQLTERRRAIREAAPDVIHVVGPHAKAFAALAGKREIKVVANWDEPATLHARRRPRRVVDQALSLWLGRRADHVVACTRAVQADLRLRHGIEAPYIPHAAYLPTYRDGVSPFSEATAVYLGSFASSWDHDLMFEAYRLLALDGYRPRLAIVGDGDDLGRWRDFVGRHGLDNIEFHGWLEGEEMWRRVRHAHVNLFPIRDTPLNRARCPSKTFAYAQARRPVITSRVGEVAELLGDQATYVEADAGRYAAAISNAMKHPGLPDVDYGIEQHSYAERAARLLNLVGGET